MDLRWTEAAAADLERIADYLSSHAPDRAPRLVTSVYEAPETLLSFPLRGRPGKKAGTRELVLSPLPWIVVYTVRDEVVHVVRIAVESIEHPEKFPLVSQAQPGQAPQPTSRAPRKAETAM